MTKALGQHLATAQPQGNVGKFYGAVSVYTGIRLHPRNPLKSTIVSPLVLYRSLWTLSQSPQRRTVLLLARHVNIPWVGRDGGFQETLRYRYINRVRENSLTIYPPNANIAQHCVRRAIGLLRGSTVLALAVY